MNETSRKVLHIVFGLFIIQVLLFLGDLGVLILGALFIVGLVLSLVSVYGRIPLIAQCLDVFDSHRNPKLPGLGPLLFLASAIVLYLIVPEGVCLTAIAILTVGDGCSAIIGKLFGHRAYVYNKRKHVEGTLAGIVAAALAASVFVQPALALFSSAISMGVESLPLPINDNITVPFTAAVVLMVLL